MRGDIRDYAKLGIAHFMFWPDCLRRTAVLMESLPRVLAREDIDAVDCCLPYDEQARSVLAPLFDQCNKRIGYAIHPIPLDLFCLGTTADHERDLIQILVRNQIEAAAMIGAGTFTVATGIDPGPDQHAAALERFTTFLGWLARELEPHHMIGLLEPFDATSYRRFLLGPTQACVRLIQSLAADHPNLRLQLDIAHVRLQGERFDDAIRASAPVLGHVHLGNCVMRDRSDIFYGDKHPPIGYPGGEIDEPELIEVLRSLLDCGYLQPGKLATLVVEAQPSAGMTAEQTIDDQLRRIEAAWKRV